MSEIERENALALSTTEIVEDLTADIEDLARAVRALTFHISESAVYVDEIVFDRGTEH